MTLMKRCLALILVCGLSGAAACARGTTAGQPPEVVLEIFNPQSVAMTVDYTVNGASVTHLGSVAARDTRRWAIPGGDITLRLVASDSAGGRTVRKALNLGKGPVVRWELRE
jgi:hypothetical protein